MVIILFSSYHSPKQYWLHIKSPPKVLERRRHWKHLSLLSKDEYETTDQNVIFHFLGIIVADHPIFYLIVCFRRFLPSVYSSATLRSSNWIGQSKTFHFVPLLCLAVCFGSLSCCTMKIFLIWLNVFLCNELVCYRSFLSKHFGISITMVEVNLERLWIISVFLCEFLSLFLTDEERFAFCDMASIFLPSTTLFE